MNKKIIFIVLAVVIVLIATWWFLGKPAVPYCKITNPLHCENDNDCVCVDAENSQQGGCFLGNKNYYEKCVDKSDVCIDFCTGWGQPPVKCINNKCTNGYKTGEVAIITDKAEYNQGEIVNIVTKNNTKKPITIFALFEFMEKFKENEWQEIGKIWKCPCGFVCDFPIDKILEPGQEKRVSWDQAIGNPCYNHKAETGIYKIGIEVLIEENRQKIYSNEFEIKTKEDLSDLKKCITAKSAEFEMELSGVCVKDKGLLTIFFEENVRSKTQIEDLLNSYDLKIWKIWPERLPQAEALVGVADGSEFKWACRLESNDAIQRVKIDKICP